MGHHHHRCRGERDPMFCCPPGMIPAVERRGRHHHRREDRYFCCTPACLGPRPMPRCPGMGMGVDLMEK